MIKTRLSKKIFLRDKEVNKYNQEQLQDKQSIYDQIHNIQAIMSTPNQSKPFTGNFELETKIRVIIQEVLAATMRKLSVFNEKIDKFEDYFMVYREKVEQVDKGCKQNKQQILLEYDQRMKLKKELTNHAIKVQETHEKSNIRFDETHNEVGQLLKTIRQVQRQNENLNSQLSKTKGKFLEYSNVISALKEQVSWKITKYIEETAQTNTNIKINNAEMKKDYFNVTLMLDKQKDKYDKIIEFNQHHENNTRRIFEDVQRLQEQNRFRFQENKKTLQKVDDYDTILQGKLKALDNKCELRISQLEKDNTKSMQAVNKLQTFNDMIQKVKEDQQISNQQILKRIQQTNKKTKDQIQVENIKLSKQLLKIEKIIEKRIVQLKQATQKSEDFLTQKINFMRMEVETEISSKTTQLMQEKENSNKVNSSTMEEVTTKINKLNLEVKKQLSKIQTSVKQLRSQTKKQLQDLKETVQAKIESIEIRPRNKTEQIETSGTQISPQLINQIEQCETKINLVNQRLNKKDQEIAQIKENYGKAEIFQTQMIAKIDTYFKEQQEDMANKVEKVMFLITKLRGDATVRTQFLEKEIKDLKKNLNQCRNYTDTLLKLTPAFGECINLILALIYDAEYQHSRIAQESLPPIKQEDEKFNTCLEGVLYEFKQKKKPGIICYRHKDLKKTQLVKTTFNAYISLWEQLFQNQFKNKSQYLPKDFYKRAVDKSVNPKVVQQKLLQTLRQNKQGNSIDKQKSSVGFAKPNDQNYRGNESQRQQNNQTLNRIPARQRAKSFRIIQGDDANKETILSKEGMGNEINMNSSFHIRKKKPLKKDEVIVVNTIESAQ